MGRIVLVTGGARSGKSSFAEAYAKTMNEDVAYIATAQVLDEEMRRRVERHKNRRIGLQWQTIEAPYEAEKAMATCTAPIIIFDCLTLYLSNLLSQEKIHQLTGDALEKKVLEAFSYLNDAAAARTGETIFVTNEVGAGIVPENALARQYRDLAGLVNQQMAVAAHAVYLVAAGIPLQLK